MGDSCSSRAFPVAKLVIGLGLVLLRCEDHRATVESRVAPLLRAPFHTTALSCLNTEDFLVAPLRTERSEARVCPGYMLWPQPERYALDVMRYGTILHIEVDDIPSVSHDAFAIPHGATLDVVHLRARVVRVLKGRAPTGPASFPVVAYDVRRGFGLGKRRQIRHGGWFFLGSGAREGLVFIPLEELPDPLFIGCLEAHFVPTNDNLGRAYMRDVELITDLLRREGPDALARATVDDARLEPLLLEGDLSMGYFLAEACDWRVALDLLKPMSTAGLPVQRGLWEGAVRMSELRHTTSYAPATWARADLSEVERRLVAWSIQDIADKGLETLRDDPRVWFLWATLTSGAPPTAESLHLTESHRRALAEQLRGTRYEDLVVGWLDGHTPTERERHILPSATGCHPGVDALRHLGDLYHAPTKGK